MKQASDKFTADILTGKRPVGRPPKQDALTPAERAKRYRDAKRLKKATSPGEPVTVPAEDYQRLKRMYWQLEGSVLRLQTERDELAAKLKAVSRASH